MSGDPVSKSLERLPSLRPQSTDGGPISIGTQPSMAPVSTDDIDDAWASAESAESSERSKPELELPRPASERGPVSERPSVTSRPPAVRVSSRPPMDPGADAARGRTLLGVAPAPQTSSDLARTPSAPRASSPTESADDGASKFEAAARLLVEQQASQAPKPPTPDTNAGATLERAAEIPGEREDATTPPVQEVATERGEMRRTGRGDAVHKARRPSSPPPTPRSSGMLPFALGAAVFAVMFLAGAMRALREEPSAAKAHATSPLSIVEGAPARSPSPSPASPTERTAAPATSAAEPIASAEPMRTGETVRVMVRSAVSGAKFYRNGKQVGMNSVIVELSPGESRTFEVDLPGHVSRKVVVDGSSSEVVVILPRLSETPVPAQADPAPSPVGESASAPPQVSPTP